MSGIMQLLNPMVPAAGASYATWNPIDKGSAIVLSNGNLSVGSSAAGSVRCTQGKSSGKWFFEVYVATAYAGMGIGIANFSSNLSEGPTSPYTGKNSVALYANGCVIIDGSILASTVGFYSQYTIGVAFDAALPAPRRRIALPYRLPTVRNRPPRWRSRAPAPHPRGRARSQCPNC